MKYKIMEENLEKKIQIEKTFLDYFILFFRSIAVIIFLSPIYLFGVYYSGSLAVLVVIIGGLVVYNDINVSRKRFHSPPIFIDTTSKTLKIGNFVQKIYPKDKIIVMRAFTWRYKKSGAIFGIPLEVGAGKINIDLSYLNRRKNVSWAIVYQSWAGFETVIAKMIFAGRYYINNFIPAKLAEDLAELLELPLIDETGEQATMKKLGQTDMFIGDTIVLNKVNFPVDEIINSNPTVFSLERSGDETFLKAKLKPIMRGHNISNIFFALMSFIVVLLLYAFGGSMLLKEKNVKYPLNGLVFILAIIFLIIFSIIIGYVVIKNLNEISFLLTIHMTPQYFELELKGFLYRLMKKNYEIKKIEGVNVVFYWKGHSLEIFSDEERCILPIGVNDKIAKDLRALLLGLFSRYSELKNG